MTGRQCKKAIWVIFAVLVGFAVLAGCSFSPGRVAKPFPSRPLDKSKYTINFNAKGEFYISDKTGKAVPSKLLPFGVVLNSADMQEPDWFEVLGTYTLYGIENNKNVWLCDDDFECYPGKMQDDPNSALFSLNYRGDGLDIGSAIGKKVEPKNLRRFAKLVEDAKLPKKSRLGIRELTTFKIYKIKGSTRVNCCPKRWKCYCSCIHDNGDVTSCDSNGECPDD